MTEDTNTTMKTMTLKDIKRLTEYSHVTTCHTQLRDADVEPVGFRRQTGRGAPVNLYRMDDVIRVFTPRLRRIGKITSSGEIIVSE